MAKNAPKPRERAPLPDPDPLRHLQKAVDVNINIQFRSDGDAALPAVPRRTAKSAGSAIEAAIPETDMERLRALDARVMAWLAASDANRQQFITDPVAALVTMDKSLGKSFVKQLQRARQARSDDAAIDPRVGLATVRVTAAKAAPAKKTPPRK